MGPIRFSVPFNTCAQRMTLNFELDIFLQVLDRINEVSVKRGSDKRGSTVSHLLDLVHGSKVCIGNNDESFVNLIA